MDIRVTADILENEQGDLLLAFHAVDGEPEKPSLGIGSSSAVLRRRDNQNVLIGYLHPEILKKLCVAEKILVTEVGSGGIVNGYFAAIKTIH